MPEAINPAAPRRRESTSTNPLQTLVSAAAAERWTDVRKLLGKRHEPLSPANHALATAAALALLTEGKAQAALTLFPSGDADIGTLQVLANIAEDAAQRRDVPVLNAAILCTCLATGQRTPAVLEAIEVAVPTVQSPALQVLVDHCCWDGVAAWLSWQPSHAWALTVPASLVAITAALQAGHALAAVCMARPYLNGWLQEAPVRGWLSRRLQTELRRRLDAQDVAGTCVVSILLAQWNIHDVALSQASWGLVDRLGSVEQAQCVLQSFPDDPSHHSLRSGASEKLLQRYVRRARWTEVESLMASPVFSDEQRYRLRKQCLERMLQLQELDRAAPLMALVRADDPERVLFDLWVLAVESRLTEAEELFQTLPPTHPHWYRTARLLYECANAVRDFVRSSRFGRILLEHRAGRPEPSRMLHIAQMASYVWGEEALMAQAIQAGYEAVAELEAEGLDDESRWDAVLNFHLRTYAFGRARKLLEKVKAQGNFDVADDEALLNDIEQGFGPVWWAVEAAAAAMRHIATTGDTSLLRTERQPNECVVHLYSGMFAARVDFEAVRHYQRKTFAFLLQALAEEGIQPVVVPQFALNEQVVLPGRHLSVSYHTIDARPGCLHVKEADLPYLINLDSSGYAGWSSLAGRSRESIAAELEKISAEEAKTFFHAEQSRVISGNISKYQQRISEEIDVAINTPYVFLALQTRWDKVQELAHVNMLQMLDIVVQRFAQSGIDLVIKRHPACQDKVVETALKKFTKLPHVRQSEASIHRLIANAKAVITTNSGVGAEALLHLKPVYLFGQAEYQYACHSVFDAAGFKEKTQELDKPLSDLELMKFLKFYRENYLSNASNPDFLQKVKNAVSHQIREINLTLIR